MPSANLRGLVIAAAAVLALVPCVPREQPAHPEPVHLAGADTTSTERSLATAPAQGIDVADHQHSHGPIQWRVVARHYEFAYIKATEGTSYVNRYYTSDSKSALRAGIEVGGYAFATPDDASGAAEANYFLRHSGYARDRTLLFPMVDLEWNPYSTGGRCYGLSRPSLTSWIRSYSDAIHRALGVTPVIYTQASFWNRCVGPTSAFVDSPLWVGSDGAASSTEVPAGFPAWEIWQSGVGSAAGVHGPVDVDTFNGTAAQLEAELTAKGRLRAQPAQAYPASTRSELSRPRPSDTT